MCKKKIDLLVQQAREMPKVLQDNKEMDRRQKQEQLLPQVSPI